MGLEPIVELELAKKEEPNEEADEPVKPAINLTQVSPTHQARVDNIRDYIQEKIEAHGGTIRSAELLKELSFLADYRYDQRRSNRTPIMYLQSFYSSWFHIEEGEKGGFTVSNYDPLAPVRVWHSEPADTSAPISAIDETEQPLQEDALPFGEEPALPVDEEPDLSEEENGSPSGEEPEVGGKSEAGDDSLDAVQPVPPSTPIAKASVWLRVLLFVLMALMMTIIEYIAGLMALKWLKVRLWDYTNEWGNIGGLICPKLSFFWALLSALYYFLIHPYILDGLRWLSENLAFSFFIGFFFGVFVIDVVYSTQIIVKMKRYAEENEIVVEVERLKEHIRRAEAEAKERTHFILPFHASRSLAEYLKEAIEAQEKKRKA